MFNLLPFYPLDGFRLVDVFAKRKGRWYWFLRQYGHYILLGLVFFHYAAGRIAFLGYFDMLGYFMDFALSVLGKPITLFWNRLFSAIGI